MVDPLAVQLVGDVQMRSSSSVAQHVEQHHGQLVGAAEGGGVAGGHGVEPAAAARPAGHGAVFAAGPADAFADAVGAVVQLGRERAAADARASTP